ncbi:helix-turn-helix domain-containing protein [Macrococcoides caseolyticum]|uniref:helix-turn-helix domain-containing protein n=1 Tax=Macrococcoides caseolyticum TaxID=69966 RepID=UPI000C337251|nr:helix-turn-helix domain-containing protein [Macrococcus caseolyticus]PKE63763.1 hypothetical protein CW683_04235 [Macrococcus caseolyticus]
MDDNNQWKEILGKFLKSKRQLNKISAQRVADHIGLSQSQISAIENGQKKTPNLKFVKDYLAFISKDTFEYNEFVDELNNLAGDKMHLAKVDIDGKIQKEVNKFKYLDKENREKNEYYDFPINDLVFHLTEKNNNKFFGSYRLTAHEKEHLIEYIYMFLKHSKESVIPLLTNKEMKIHNQIKNLIEKYPDTYSQTDEYKELFYLNADISGDLQMNKLQLYEIEKIYHHIKNNED